jgi:hypothetical protein
MLPRNLSAAAHKGASKDRDDIFSGSGWTFFGLPRAMLRFPLTHFAFHDSLSEKLESSMGKMASGKDPWKDPFLPNLRPLAGSHHR